MGLTRRCIRIIFGAVIALFTAVLVGNQAWPQSQDWEVEAQKKVDALIEKNGPGTDLNLQKRLLQMMEEDQAIRHKLFDAPADKQGEIVQALEEGDRERTAELKEIIQKHGWPTIQLVGIKASQAAAGIFNHSPDHEFQGKMLPQLTRMVEQEEIVGSDLGHIIDKVLLSEGRPQLFGTVFRFEGEFLIMEPVQDPEHLDQRRAKYLLPPMNIYIRDLETMYHKKLK